MIKKLIAYINLLGASDMVDHYSWVQHDPSDCQHIGKAEEPQMVPGAVVKRWALSITCSLTLQQTNLS